MGSPLDPVEPNQVGKLDDLPQAAPGTPGGLAGPLDGSGMLPTSQLPQTAITDTFVVADQAARLALSAQTGDVAIQTDVNLAYILQSAPPSVNGNWVQLPVQPYTTSTHGGSGNAGKLLALDADGKADGQNLLALGQTVDARTSSNTASTIVARDASGNFSAGTITANLTGTASGNDVLGAAAAVQTNLTSHINDATDAHLSTAIGYTPAVSGNWSPSPTTDAGGLDQLASRVKTLETTPAGVSSFNGRTGAVSPADGDYSQSLITGLKTSSSPSFVAVTSTVATGTAPLTVTSTTKVQNLNADMVDGFSASQTPTASTIPVANSSNAQLAPAWIASGSPSLLNVPTYQFDGSVAWQAPQGGGGGTVPGWYSSGPNTIANGETRYLSIGVCSTPLVLPFVQVQTAGSTNTSNTDWDFDLADEASYTQEDATNGTDFVGGSVQLHTDTPGRVILLHLDGSDASTTITDNGSNGPAHTWACIGNAQLDTAQAKFGTASLLLDGSGDRLQLTATADMSFTGDFTISMWVRPNVIAGSIRILMVPSDTSNNFQLAVYTDGRIDFYQGSTQVCTSSAGAVVTGSWQYVALTRSGSTCKIWVGGVEVASGTRSGTLGRSDSNINFGMYANGSYPYDGWIDELMVNSTTCLYTGTFTPPASAWADTAYPTTAGGYYVYTSSSIGFPLQLASQLDSMTITQAEPTNTSVRWLYTTDGGTTWKNHSGSTVALSEIITSGSTAAQIQTLFTAWSVPTGATTLMVACALKTTDSTVTPTVSSAFFQWDGQPTYRASTDLTEWQIDLFQSTVNSLVSFKRVSGGTVTCYINAIKGATS